jgi:hypothetical protein
MECFCQNRKIEQYNDRESKSILMKQVKPLSGSTARRGTFCVYSRWSFVASMAIMALLLFRPATASAQNSFFDVFADITPQGGSPVGAWFEVPYTPGTTPSLYIQNFAGTQETLSNVGFLLSPTEIPLDNLNFDSYPESSYTPLPQYDGSSISPQSSEDISAPDQSSTMTLFSLAGAGILVCRRALQSKRFCEHFNPPLIGVNSWRLALSLARLRGCRR